MFHVEYVNREGNHRTVSCTPDELFEVLRIFRDCYITVTEIWKVSNGYMGRAYVYRKGNVVEVRDHYGDLIEAREEC